jgi:hypothetical protein
MLTRIQLNRLSASVLALVFGSSVGFKVLDPATTLRSIARTVPHLDLVPHLFHALLAIEIWVVVWAIFFGDNRIFKITVSLLLFLFSAYITVKIFYSDNSSCGCMGAFGNRVLGSWENTFGLVRNFLLITIIWIPNFFHRGAKR